MPNENVSEASEVTYNLVYRPSLDVKRRLPVPYRWRPKTPIDFTLVVWPKNPAGACLRVYPPAAWEKFRAQIDAVEDNAIKPVLKRMIGSYSTTMKLDGAGRLTIPEEMALEADISNQVVLAGLLDKFEIWNPTRYDATKTKDTATYADSLVKLGIGE